MMRIAITGDRGFIGRHLYRALAAFYGHQPEAMVRVDCIDLKDGGDILDAKVPEADVIFHLAAQTDVMQSVRDPMHDAMTNIAGTIQVLKENPHARVIIPGSAAAVAPESPYGVSKRAQELYAHVLHQNAVVCVLPNIYGENGHGVVEAFLRDEKPTVYGDGMQTRQFLHVEDAVVALMRAMELPRGTYFCGGTPARTVLELAEATGKEYEHAPAREGEVRDSHIANTMPDWKPAIDVIEYIQSKRYG